MATGGTDASVVGLGEGGMQWVPPFQLKNGSGSEMFGVDSSGNLTFAGTFVSSAANLAVTNTAPSLSLQDSTGSALDLIIKVDANKAHMYEESAGAAGDLISMDLSTGTAKVGIGTASPTASTLLDVNGVAAVGSGAVTAPGLAFRADLDCGLYRIGSNNIGVAVGGAKVLDVAASGLGIVGKSTLTTAGALRVIHIESVAMADDAVIALETLCGATGSLEVVAGNGLAYGQFMLCAAAGAGAGTATLIDTGLLADDADTDTKVCVYTDGDGTFSIKNRLGSSQNFILTYKGV